MAEQTGSLRQRCEIVDYRYTPSPSHSLDPFVYRNLWRDVQIWVPALSCEPVQDSSTSLSRKASKAIVVIQTCPLLTWLWIGLAVALVAAAFLVDAAWTRPQFRRST